MVLLSSLKLGIEIVTLSGHNYLLFYQKATWMPAGGAHCNEVKTFSIIFSETRYRNSKQIQGRLLQNYLNITQFI